MIDLLTDRTLTGPEAQITQTVYDLWMDWDARNSEGVSALSSVINDIREIDSLEDLTAYQSRFETAVSSIMLMDAYTSADLNDSTHYTVYVDPMEFILEDPYYYTYLGQDGYNMQPVYTDTIYKMLIPFTKCLCAAVFPNRRPGRSSATAILSNMMWRSTA